MIRMLIAAMDLLAIGSSPQTVDSEKWNTVEWVEDVPVKGTSATFDTKRNPAKNPTVHLYSREKELPCCGTAGPLAEAITDRQGIFQFKSASPGSYWVVIEANEKKFTHSVNYVPGSKNKTEVSCSDLFYDLRNAELQLGRAITAD